jgi:hypothetical protein
MGWNQGYAIFEQTVIGAYGLGKLDKQLLSVLMEPYRHTDIDSGGKEGLITKDGKEVEQVVIETWGLKMPEPPAAPRPAWRKDFSKEEEALDKAWDQYFDQRYDLFSQVTDHFGWR